MMGLMHVALLANTAWLDEELSQLHHVVVGLIDESVRVAQVLPAGRAEDEVSGFGERVSWTEGRSGWRNRYRLASVHGALDEAGVDLVHALDGRLWWAGAELARRLDCPLVLTANAAADIPLSRRMLRRVNPARTAVVATTEPIGREVREAIEGRMMVEVIPPGVHRGGDVEVSGDEAERAEMCVVVSGDGRMDDQYASFMAGAVELVRDRPGVQLFFDGMGTDQHELWKAARRMELLHNLSMIPRRLGHRELLLRADVLVLPQALGKSRSLALQAMAAGVPILARQDPYLDYLVPDQTAVVMPNPSPAGWSDALRIGLTDPGRLKALGQRAQLWSREHRVAADQVAAILSLYRGLTGASIPFPG